LPALAVGARFLIAAGEAANRSRPGPEIAVATTGASWWTADGDLDGLGRVVARITALHADAARQEFETGALHAHGVGTDAEPYWLQVEFGPGADAAALLDPRDLRVEDAHGVALAAAPSSGDRSTDPRGAVDPVATLLRPSAPLAAGQVSSLVVFGRRPGEGARLVRADGAGLALVESTGAPGSSDLPIASVDRTGPAATEREQ
jgi:hypothetical protein